MMIRLLRPLLYVAMCLLALPVAGARASLIVDFADGTNNVPATAAPFVFANGAASPISRNYTHGSQGYTGEAFDTGAGVTATLRSFRSTDGALNTSTIRMLDRNNANVDLISDWASVEPGGSSPIIGLQLTIIGLASGTYDFASLHDDTSNQGGVLDAQYSLDGGTNWINLVDNASYGGGVTVSVAGAEIDSAFGFSIRYLVGGGLFGGNGQTTDSVASNRLMPFNSFELTVIELVVPAPEPASLTHLLVAGLGGLSIRKRREKVA